MRPRVVEAYWVPWWPSGKNVAPAEVEYIGLWPDGGTGMCVRRFDAGTVSESNRQARTFALALELAGDRPVLDRGEFWEIPDAA